MNRKKRILAINFGGIGDEILFFPTLKTIKSVYPDSHLTMVVEPRSSSAKNLTKLIDDTITCDIKTGNTKLNVLKLLFKIWMGSFDMVISSGGSTSVSVLLFLTGIKERYGYDSGKLSRLLLTKTIPLNWSQYAVNMYHDLTSPIAEGVKPTIPEVDVSPEDIFWAANELASNDKKIIILHPGVSKLSIQKNIIKFWPSENWIELVIRLLNTGKYKVVLAGGPDDGDIFAQINSSLEEKGFDKDENLLNLFGKTKSISQLAALIKASDLLVSVDSSSMHIGVGVRTRVAAIFGPTDENKLLPVDNLNFTAVTNGCECRPCLWEKRQVSCEKLDCLKISTDQVFDVIEGQLAPAVQS